MPTARTAASPPAFLGDLARSIDDRLAGFVSSRDLPGPLRRAVEHALLGGGKRLRPILTLLSAQAVGGSPARAEPAALAVELVHAFSLVHDDLPALDNDDLRRGRPTLHRAHGEAMAILTGDLMLGLAVEALVTDAPDDALAGRLVAELISGVNAMIVGQADDTLGVRAGGGSDAERLESIHRQKTGALIRAACRMGAIAGSGGTAQAALPAVTRYAEAVGLMFQIVDDLLDVEQTTEHLGKSAGKDADAGKLTYPVVHGVEASRDAVARLRAEALSACEALGPSAGRLAEVCEFLAVRTR